MFLDTIFLITGKHIFTISTKKKIPITVSFILGELNCAYAVDICDAHVVAVATAGLEPAPNPSTLDSLSRRTYCSRLSILL